MNGEILANKTHQALGNTEMSLIERVIQFALRTHPSIDDVLNKRRSGLIAAMSLVMFIIGIAIFIFQLIAFPQIVNDPDTWVLFVAILVTFGVYLVNRLGHVNLAVVSLITAMNAVFIIVPFMPGAITDLLYFAIIPVLLTAIFFTLQATIRLTVVLVCAIATLGLLTQNDFVMWPIQFLILAGGALFVFIKHLQFQERLNAQVLEDINRQLKASEESLEQRVVERTRDLELASEVSKEAARVIDLDTLLPNVAALTRTAFDLYHVSIFVYDEHTRVLRLDAGTGEEGARMKNINKRFHLDAAQGIVPKAAREGQAIAVNDTANSDVYFVNPILPDTRSEIALPMQISGQLIGVMDLQSEQVNRFSDDDLRVFQMLADQIAISISNSQRFAETVAARKQAEQADQVKSMFLASMSHELRTPLNAIINFTKFVARGIMGTVNDKQVETLTNVINSAEHLLSLINDVLDISKIEAGSLSLFPQDDLDIAEIITSTQKTAMSLLAEKPVDFVIDIEPDLPLITGDSQRILQVMLNIVSNACKFTKEGEIRVIAKTRQDELIVTVKDSGPGIASEDYESVFEKFKQTNTGLRQGSGTGLGMPISRSLVEAHGGRLWIESVPGEGAAFIFTLPIHLETEAQSQAS